MEERYNSNYGERLPGIARLTPVGKNSREEVGIVLNPTPSTHSTRKMVQSNSDSKNRLQEEGQQIENSIVRSAFPI